MRNYEEEIKARVAFIQKKMEQAHADGLVFGNSGGKDSALVGILCSMATKNLLAVAMPCNSKRNYGEDLDDATALAKNFGIGSRSVDRLYRLRTLISVIMDMLDNAQITQSTALKIATLPKDVQVMMYDLEYPLHRKITPDMLNRLQNVRNKSEVNDIFSEKLYYISPKKIPIDVPVPKDFEKISIAASSDDMEIIRTELKNISDKLSEESKLILLKILGNR